MAARLGIKQGSLSELESGESKAPSADVLMKACNLLRLRPEYLLYGEGPPEGRDMHDLTGPEAQLVMLYRQLPNDAMRAALIIDADARVKKPSAPSPARKSRAPASA